MMPETRTVPFPATPARRPALPTRAHNRAHTPRGPVHTVHNAVPGIPCSAAPDVDTGAGASAGAHTPRGRVHTGPVRGTAPRPETVRFLVHMARWVAPVGGGALLVSAGVYAGPVSVIPAPILFCLAACAFAVDTTTVGGVR